MNILSIEKTRNELISFLENTSSRRLKAKRISEFFSLLIEQKSYSLIESYLLEFLPKYLDYLKTYSPIGINPEFTLSIIQINSKLIEVVELTEYKEKLSQINNEVDDKLFSLNKVLSGEQVGLSEERKAFFPLIEDEESKSISQTIGAIDSITIKISKAKEKDKFIVVPSENEKDKKLEEQINICWKKAKEFCKQHVKKINPHHEVITSFDGNLGIYRGESLGAALTIAMIEEMLKFYNSQTVLTPMFGTAFTGGINENGELNPITKPLIEKKVEIAFYSHCTTLTVPKEDESLAVEKIKELKDLYPNRNLEIVGVKTLNEILLRRDLVEIKKQKFIVRAGKFIKKNWVSAVVTILLSILFAFLFVMDFDDNPSTFENDGLTLLIKNKRGKILWTKKIQRDFNKGFGSAELDNYVKIVDINNDLINEVLICKNILITKEYEDVIGDILCLNTKNQVVRKYSFSDTVYSEGETLTPPFNIEIIDTLTLNNKKQIILFANNGNSFASTVFKLDLETGKRIEAIHWASGFTYESLVKDINNDRILEVILVGYDNGFNEHMLWVISSNELNGYRPSTEYKKIKYMPEAKLLRCIRFPKTDYEKFISPKSFAMNQGSIMTYAAGYITVTSFIVNIPGIDNYSTAIIYQFTENLQNVDIYIGSRFRELRDTLVVKGILNKPFTETREYKKIIKDNLLYYKNGEWVKREELE